MKIFLEKTTKVSLVIITCLLSFPLGAQQMEAQKISLTGPEIWEKVIAYHDPDGKWDNFAGQVHLVTVFSSDNKPKKAILEIRNAENFYQWTSIGEDVTIVRGFKDGECFRAVNGNDDLSEDEIKKYRLDCDNIGFMREHQTCHFGLPMALKSSGMTVENKVEQVNFNGTKCYALTFIGKPDAVKHSFYERTLTLYIDPLTHALRGSSWKSDTHPGAHILTAGELEINGIKMPQVTAVYHNKDNTHWYSDVFTAVVKNPASE